MPDTSTTPTSLKECALLRDFKDFLSKSQQREGEVSKGTEAAATQNFFKRPNKDTYFVTSDEKVAEITFTLRSILKAKGCPRNFQTKLLHTAKARTEQELHNSKECEVDTNTDEQPQWDLSKLQKFIANQLDKLLTELSDNAARNQLGNYADADSICNEMMECKCRIAQSEMSHTIGTFQNNLRKMEDRNVCLDNFGKLYGLPTNYSFYGVFDGHGGARCANYTASQLPQLLANELLRKEESTIDDEFYRLAFESAFLKTDENFAKKKLISGTTAVCALITHQPNRRLYVAWAGDSKASLCSPDNMISIVTPHKPKSADERKRIIDAGGSVIFMEKHYRVNGILNVSRSIGDYKIAPVIANPDFMAIELTSSHDFLILGSDGFWDHIGHIDVRRVTYNHLRDKNMKLEDIPNHLIDEAFLYGNSRDNITVVIVLLKQRSNIVEDYNNSFD